MILLFDDQITMRVEDPKDLDPTFNYIPLRAPQSWAVQPGNLNRYSRARGGIVSLHG